MPALSLSNEFHLMPRTSGGDMADGMQKDWRELCTAVVNETDSSKLSSLVQKLVEALDAGRQNKLAMEAFRGVLESQGMEMGDLVSDASILSEKTQPPDQEQGALRLGW